MPPEALRVDRQTDGGKSLGGKEGEGGLLFFLFFIIVVGLREGWLGRGDLGMVWVFYFKKWLFYLVYVWWEV